MSQTSTLPVDPSAKRPKLCAWILGIVLITLCFYAPLLSSDKEFTNWDDDGYVTNQPLITGLDGAHLARMFDPSAIVMFNYHPLTMLSLAIDYQRAYDEDTQTLSVRPFAATNLLLHLLNTVLVFQLLYRLSEKRSLLLAAIAATLFGIHPLHVESVAWISARKDLLYGCFFLFSCLAYLRYLNEGKMGWLACSLLCFVASGLSKAMAVPLPFVLLLIDYLRHRPFTGKVLAEKAPFLIVAIVIGLYTLKAQQGAIADPYLFSAGQKLLFAGTALGRYLFKWVLPVQLSAFYPYPDAQGGGALPGMYYLVPLLVLAATVLTVFVVRRKRPELTRALAFGFGFFVLMIALVLPIIGVGSAIMAERYMYVSSVGLLFLLPALLAPLMDHPRAKRALLGVLFIATAGYGLAAYARIPVWDNSRSLWADVVRRYPIQVNGQRVTNGNAKTAYKNLGDYYASHDQYDSAFVLYQTLTAAGTRDAEVWANLGNIYVARKDMPQALQAFSQSIALDSTNADTYMVRAIILGNDSHFREAVKDIDKVLQLRPDDQQAKAIREDMLKRVQ